MRRLLALFAAIILASTAVASPQNDLLILLRPKFTPRALAGNLVSWFDAADNSTITIATGVSAWKDKATGLSATQGTGSAQPTYSATSGPNSKPGISFAAGSTQFLLMGSTNIPQLWTAVMVGIENVPGACLGWSFENVPKIADPGRFGGATIFQPEAWNTVPTGFNANGVTIVSGAAHIFTASRQSAQIAAAIDGNPLNTPVATTGTPNSGAVQGAIGASGTGGFPCTVEWSELIFINGNSTGNQQKTEGYLAWKWGLQGNLPAGHPYKNSPP
jgi:hypothetical protein